MSVINRYRRVPLVLASAVLVLAACGEDSTSEESGETSDQPNEAGLPQPEQTELHIGLSGEYTANIMHAIMVQHLDLPPKYGFDNIEFSNFEGAGPANQSLVAGQIDASDNSGGPVVASLATDAPLVMPFITRSNLTDNFYAQPDITSADQLRGGSIAISSFGSQSHAGALVSLAALGLTAEDVTIMQIGNDSARAAALQSGSVTASMNDAVLEDDLNDLGFNILVRLAEEEGLGGVVRTSLTFTRDFVEENPNTVLNLVAMYLEGNLAWRNDPDVAAEALAEFSEMSLEEARSDIDSVLSEPWEPLDGRCDEKAMKFTQETLLPINPDLADVDPTEACTDEFIDQLDELGYLDELGVPDS